MSSQGRNQTQSPAGLVTLVTFSPVKFSNIMRTDAGKTRPSA